MLEPLDRFLSGGRTDDPLYLSNRTFGEKVMAMAWFLIPLGLVLAGVGAAMMGVFSGPSRPAPADLSPAQIAQRQLPDLNKNIEIEVNKDLEVVDVHIEPTTPARVAGTIRNKTIRDVAQAELVFDLTTNAGSRLGAVSTHVRKVPALGTVKFAFTIPQEKAAFVLVREIRTR